MDEFICKLKLDFNNQIQSLNSLAQSARIKHSLEISVQTYDKLKEFVKNHQFSSDADEINYFKVTKPEYQSSVIYYSKLSQITSNVPIGSVEKKKEYYFNILDHLSFYCEENKEFINYYRSNNSKLDSLYFVRKNVISEKSFTINTEIDYNQCTGYDFKVAAILAYERLERFIHSELRRLDQFSEILLQDHQMTPQTFDELVWSDSKIALIELIYALHSVGVCNNGNTDIKTISAHFEKIFQIEIGDPYKGYSELKERKITRTKFLNRLIETLNKRMDNDDEL